MLQTDRRQLLATVSAVQLATGVAGGLSGSLRRRRHQVPGYLGERLVRWRLRPSGWDAVESRLLAAATALPAAMAWLARPG